MHSHHHIYSTNFYQLQHLYSAYISGTMDEISLFLYVVSKYFIYIYIYIIDYIDIYMYRFTCIYICMYKDFTYIMF